MKRCVRVTGVTFVTGLTPGRTEQAPHRLSRLSGLVLLVSALVLWWAGAAPAAQAAATTWYVSPSGDDTTNDGKSAAKPFKTIAKGISAATGGTATSSGDTVLLADGTYQEHDLDYAGKAITVRSASDDPTKCILDCQQKGRGFAFHSGETSTSVLQGITITKGRASGSVGGGMYNFNSSPTITNCTFSHNAAANYGGGMATWFGSNPTVTNCTFVGNTSGFIGGAIFNNVSNSTVTNCILWGDVGALEGGEIAGAATITYSDL
jgi:hypothetical protein